MGGTSKQTQDVFKPPARRLCGAINCVGRCQRGDWPIAKSVATYAGTAASVCGTDGDAQAGNPYAGAIGDYASNLLGGGGVSGGARALERAKNISKSALPYASGSPIAPTIRM